MEQIQLREQALEDLKKADIEETAKIIRKLVEDVTTVTAKQIQTSIQRGFGV